MLQRDLHQIFTWRPLTPLSTLAAKIWAFDPQWWVKLNLERSWSKPEQCQFQSDFWSQHRGLQWLNWDAYAQLLLLSNSLRSPVMNVAVSSSPLSGSWHWSQVLQCRCQQDLFQKKTSVLGEIVWLVPREQQEDWDLLLNNEQHDVTSKKGTRSMGDTRIENGPAPLRKESGWEHFFFC